MSETFQRLDKSFFQNPKELGDLINKENLVHEYLPKQMDIDKILEVIQRKALKGTHLPVEIKEIQVGYLCGQYFKDLYLYLLQNKLPSSKSVIRKLETLAEKYVLLDSLSFGISPEKETAVLAIPETCTDKIITLYHKSLFAGHQGVIKTYLTISDKFFIPNLIHYLRSYIKGCHICQLSHNEKLPSRCYNVITKFCIPEYIIMDQDSAFMSSLMTYLFHRFNIKIKTVAPYNHQLLQAKHGIK